MAFSKLYSVNKNFFSNYAAQESSWVLGWMYADGCVHNGRMTIRLNSNDIEVLRKIKEVMEYTGPVYEHKCEVCKTGKTCSIGIYDEELIRTLKELGCTERKSLTLTYPWQIQWVSARHFIRGYFEGDGCVTFNKSRNYISIKFKGTKEFLEGIKKRLERCLEVRSTICKTNNTVENVYDLYISGNNQSIRFLNWIYLGAKEGTILKRKYDKALELYDRMVRNRKQQKVRQPLNIQIV